MFWGQYSSIGGKCIYDVCCFENMVFKNGLWTNVNFKNCHFSGKVVNAYWEDVWSDSRKAKLTFLHCDMREMIFENVTIKNGMDFSTTKLTNKFIRLFYNNNSQFSNAFIQASKKDSYDQALKICLKIVGEFSINQHPVIFDTKHLDNYPVPPLSKARLAFKKIAAEFEIINYED